MSELEPIEEAPTCPVCKKPKVRLRLLTEKKNLPIWICAEKGLKGRAPCDGPTFEMAQKNNLA